MADTTVTPRLLDRDGAAQYLATSTDTIDRAIHAGILPIVRLPVVRARKSTRGTPGASRRVLIDIRDLDALVERGKEMP